MGTPTTIDGLFRAAADRNPTALFLWHHDTTISYHEARETVAEYAAVFAQHDIGPGDRVGILSPNHPAFLYSLFATARCGATAVLLNHRLEGDGLNYLVDDADLTLAVVDSSVADTYQALDATDDVATTLYLDRPAASNTPTIDEALTDVTPADAPAPGTADPDDVAVITYTSGTTGPPKGVQNPHTAFIDAGQRLATACNTDSTDRGLLVLPLFHANPLTYGVMHMLSVGGSLALVESFSASQFLTTARAADATFFTHVGSVLEILDQATVDATTTDTPLEFAVGGAANFSIENQDRFEDRFDLHLVRLYGLTELGAGLVTTCTYDPYRTHGPHHQGSITDQPFEIRIRTDDGHGWAAPGETGEILIRPDEPGLMFHGYRNKPAETVADWQDLWMHTGDRGYIRDGNLHFVGRDTANIRRHGENISPWEIEQPLTDWERVETVAAVGVEDDVVGEEIHVFVVPTDEPLTPAAVHAQCEAVLPEHLVPRYISVVDDLPMTSTEKIQRTTLETIGSDDAWDATTETPAGQEADE